MILDGGLPQVIMSLASDFVQTVTFLYYGLRLKTHLKPPFTYSQQIKICVFDCLPARHFFFCNSLLCLRLYWVNCLVLYKRSSPNVLCTLPQL